MRLLILAVAGRLIEHNDVQRTRFGSQVARCCVVYSSFFFSTPAGNGCDSSDASQVEKHSSSTEDQKRSKRVAESAW